MDRPRAWRPRPWRLALASLAAPVAGAGGVIGAGVALSSVKLWLLGEPPGIGASNTLAGAAALMVYAVPIAYALAIVAGVPLYLWLVRRGGYGVRRTVLAGCGVTVPAMATLAAVGAATVLSDGTGGRPGEQLGMYAGIGSMILAGGALGGLVFWVSAAWRDPRLAATAACPQRPLG